MDGKRESRNSVLSAQLHDDNDDDRGTNISRSDNLLDIVRLSEYLMGMMAISCLHVPFKTSGSFKVVYIRDFFSAHQSCDTDLESFKN